MENVLADRAPMRLRRPARLLQFTSDERLVTLVRGGDEGAFEALYDRHHPAILGFCRHMLGTREEAEDAVQHTFLAAFRDLVGSEKPIDLRPWLFAIARNRCLSALRARRAHVAIELAEPAVDGLAAAVERREDVRELLGDLARLPEDQRAALLLAELGALDHTGIATVLGCPREKVKALVFQARTSLAASREARATPCEDIRVELATATGAALRRGPLRRHLRTCDGCRAFKTEVATQRKLLALALPVVPSLALKASVLGGSGAPAAGGGTASAGTAAVAGTTSGGGLGGGLLGTVATTGVGKVAVSLAVASAVAGGGAFTAQLEQRGSTHAAPAPSYVGTPDSALDPQAAFGRRAARHGASDLLPASGPGLTPQGQTHHPAGPSALGIVVPTHTLTPTPAHGSPGAAHLPVHPAPVLEIGPAPLPPQPRQDKQPSSAPPGHTGTPPGQSSTPPGQAKTPPGQSTTPPGQSTTPPGQAKTPPGQSTTPPGQTRTPPPGQSTTLPGQSNIPGPAEALPSSGGHSLQGPAGGSSANGALPAGAGTSSPGQSGASHGQASGPRGHAG